LQLPRLGRLVALDRSETGRDEEEEAARGEGLDHITCEEKRAGSVR
jgi:hypothetical protein